MQSDIPMSDIKAVCEDFVKLLGVYQDVYISNRESSRHRAMREATAVHALNHVLRSVSLCVIVST